MGGKELDYNAAPRDMLSIGTQVTLHLKGIASTPQAGSAPVRIAVHVSLVRGHGERHGPVMHSAVTRGTALCGKLPTYNGIKTRTFRRQAAGIQLGNGLPITKVQAQAVVVEEGRVIQAATPSFATSATIRVVQGEGRASTLKAKGITKRPRNATPLASARTHEGLAPEIAAPTAVLSGN